MNIFLGDIDSYTLDQLKQAKKNIVKQIRLAEENETVKVYDHLVQLYHTINDQEQYLLSLQTTPTDDKGFNLDDYKPYDIKGNT